MSAPTPSAFDLPDSTASRKVNDDFVNLTAHELRNPLRALALDAEHLARHLRSGHLAADATDMGDVAERMAVAARRMSEQINDLLALATGHRSGQEPEVIELGLMVDEILAEFGDDLTRIGATVEVEPLPALLGTKPPLRMLFRNLIGNAIRHRHRDRPLQLSISTKSYQLQGSGRLLQLTVSDNGVGVRAADHRRIFEPYSRASDRSDGLGLGLAICDRTVNRLGGTIHVESDGETGSSFVILIKDDDPAQVRRPAANSTEGPDYHGSGGGFDLGGTR